jgi:hypothetical protein
VKASKEKFSDPNRKLKPKLSFYGPSRDSTTQNCFAERFVWGIRNDIKELSGHFLSFPSGQFCCGSVKCHTRCPSGMRFHNYPIIVIDRDFICKASQRFQFHAVLLNFFFFSFFPGNCNFFLSRLMD